MSNFGETGFIALQAIVSKQFPTELTNTSSLFRLTCLLLQTGRSPLGVERVRSPLKVGQRPNVYSGR